MQLTAEQIALRQDKITASFLPSLMIGDSAKIYDKWLELTGDPRWKPEDFANNWPVQFGSFIEGFALDWHQRRTSQAITRRGEVVQHPKRKFFCCTLDGYRAEDRTVIDAKSTGRFAWPSIDDCVRFYTPQLVAQRACTGAERASLLVVHGGAEPQEIEIYSEPEYEAQLWERVDSFELCVELMVPPVEAPAAIVPPEKYRTIDLETATDNWRGEMEAALTQWDVNEAAGKAFGEAKDAVKALLPSDVGVVTWKSLSVLRNRAGAVSVKRRKA